MHSKIDKLFDGLDSLKDRTSDALDDMKISTEMAADSAQRAACRGKAWLRDALIDAQIGIDGVVDKFQDAKESSDKKAAEIYVKAIEKYAQEMSDIAKEATEEAEEAAEDADKARRSFSEKFD